MAATNSKNLKQLFSRGLALVFQVHTKTDMLEEPHGSLSLKNQPNGNEIFRNFIQENRNCYWDPHLQESVRNVKYVGLIEPSTVLIGGRDIFVNTLKSAWERNVLRSPSNASLCAVGEVPDVDLRILSRSQFMHLPDALCMIISDMNKSGKFADLDQILIELKRVYQDVRHPSDQVVYETLGLLLKEGKLVHTESGYQVMCEAYRLTSGCTCVGHNMQNVDRSTMRSVSCQTAHCSGNFHVPRIEQELHNPSSIKNDHDDDGYKTTKEHDRAKSRKKHLKNKSGLRRRHSMKEGSHMTREEWVREMDIGESLLHSNSFTDNTDLTALQKEDNINLRTSDAHQDKNKGEKDTLFGKLFGRKKKGSMTEASSSPVPVVKEYATFCDQFPPPEWTWYESQIQNHSPRTIVHHCRNKPASCDEYTDRENYGCSFYALSATSCMNEFSMAHSSAQDSPRALRDANKHSDITSTVGDMDQNKDQQRSCLAPPAHLGESESQNRQDSHHVSGLKNHASQEARVSKHTSPVSPTDSDTQTRWIACTKDRSGTHPRHSTRKSRIFRKYRELQDTGFDKDMAILNTAPKEMERIQASSGLAKSRDSGVNCVGVVPPCTAHNAPQKHAVLPSTLNQITSPDRHEASGSYHANGYFEDNFAATFEATGGLPTTPIWQMNKTGILPSQQYPIIKDRYCSQIISCQTNPLPTQIKTENAEHFSPEAKLDCTPRPTRINAQSHSVAGTMIKYEKEGQKHENQIGHSTNSHGHSHIPNIQDSGTGFHIQTDLKRHRPTMLKGAQKQAAAQDEYGVV